MEKLEHDSQQQYNELMHLRDEREAVIATAVREKDEEVNKAHRNPCSIHKTISVISIKRFHIYDNNTNPNCKHLLMKCLPMPQKLVLVIFFEKLNCKIQQLIVLKYNNSKYIIFNG